MNKQKKGTSIGDVTLVLHLNNFALAETELPLIHYTVDRSLLASQSFRYAALLATPTLCTGLKADCATFPITFCLNSVRWNSEVVSCPHTTHNLSCKCFIIFTRLKLQGISSKFKLLQTRVSDWYGYREMYYWDYWGCSRYSVVTFVVFLAGVSFRGFT